MAQLRLCNSLRDSAPASFQHEVIALSEKVIVRLEDLVKWTVPDFSGWDNSLKAEPLKPSVLRELGTNGRREALHRYRESTLTSGLNFKDVQRERAQLGELRQRPQFLFSLLWGYFLLFSFIPKGYCHLSTFSGLLCWMFMYLCPMFTIYHHMFIVLWLV